MRHAEYSFCAEERYRSINREPCSRQCGISKGKPKPSNNNRDTMGASMVKQCFADDSGDSAGLDQFRRQVERQRQQKLIKQRRAAAMASPGAVVVDLDKVRLQALNNLRIQTQEHRRSAAFSPECHNPASSSASDAATLSDGGSWYDEPQQRSYRESQMFFSPPHEVRRSPSSGGSFRSLLPSVRSRHKLSRRQNARSHALSWIC